MSQVSFVSVDAERSCVGKSSYKLKYKLLKRCIKEIVLENAALCERASETQQKLIIAQEERKFLWKKYSTTQGNNFNGNFAAEDISTTSMNNGAAANLLTSDLKKTRKNTTLKNGGQSRPRQTASKTKHERKTEKKALSNDNQTA